MRDIEDYQKEYLVNYPFEPYLAKARKKIILKIIADSNSKNILEIGCAMDPLFRYFDSFDRYTVLEPGKTFCDMAEVFAKEHNKSEKITVINEYFEGITDQIHSYDFVICSGLLHEVTDQNEFVKNLYKLADKHTIVHINMPNVNSFHRILAKKAELIKSVYEKSEMQISKQQSEFFNLSQLKNFCLSNGFKIESEGTFSFKPFTHRQMQKIMDHKIIDETVLFALLEMNKYYPEFGSEMYVNIIRRS